MNVAVTGAFGYSGKYIAERLLTAGHGVLTLTNSPNRPNPFGSAVRVAGFHFDEPEKLAQSLQGIDSLINTYWVRFDHRLFTHEQAVANTKVLFNAAKNAGVRRIVHISITHPDSHSDLPYFRGKAELELALQSLDVSYCILRPTVLFGKEDILINNIAWSLRHLPVFAVFGHGNYRMQPIYVDDLAAAAVEQSGRMDNVIINAIGPETFTYRELIRMIMRILNIKRPIIGVPPTFVYWATRALGLLVNDVIITKPEIHGLMDELLYVDVPPLGNTKLSEWIEKHKETLGRHYTSELARRRDRVSKYRSN